MYAPKDEEVPFLSQGESNDWSAPPRATKATKARVFLSYKFQIALHAILLIIYTTIANVYIKLHNSSSCLSSENGISGALKDLKLELSEQKFTPFQDSPFAGPPSPETDDAWGNLMSTINIRVSAEELAQSNQTSIELPGGGYMAWLGVFHELHCVKMLRQWIYRDTYHVNLTQAEEDHWSIHADHCLEMLRASAICHGDASLTTFVWDTPSRPVLDLKRPVHKCVDWDGMMESLSYRVVDEQEDMRLVKPEGVHA